MTHAEQSAYLFRHLLEDAGAAVNAEASRLGRALTLSEYKVEVEACIQAYRDRGVPLGPFEVEVTYDYAAGKYNVVTRPAT